MFNKYNIIIVLILISSFIVGYKKDDISTSLKKIFSKKEEFKFDPAAVTKEVKQEQTVGKEEENKNNQALPAVVYPLQQNPGNLGKTLDSISAGTIPEEQIRKHQEYLKNITTKLKDFQGGEANIPVETPPPVVPTQPQNVDGNQAYRPLPITPIPPMAPGFEQETPLNPSEEVEEETDDDSEDPNEADDNEIDDADEDNADDAETEDTTSNLK